MSNNTQAMALILTMTAVTMATRFLPFLLLGDKRQTPPFVAYLGKVLPYAIMGMLVVYCLKNVNFPRKIEKMSCIRDETMLSYLGLKTGDPLRKCFYKGKSRVIPE